MQFVQTSMQTAVPSPIIVQTTGMRVHTPAPNPSPVNQTVVPSPAYNPLHSPAPSAAQHGMTPSPQQVILFFLIIIF